MPYADRPSIQYGRIDAIGSIQKAIDHTRFVLFGPFDLNKWIAFGVIIFLSILGTGGSGVGMPNFQSTGGGAPPTSPGEALEDFREFISENLNDIILVAAIVLLIGLALSVLIAWLGARGRLMFVRAVALNDSRIGVNWTEAGKLSASLFWFSILLMVITWIYSLAIAGLAYYLLVRGVDAGAETFPELFPYLAWPLVLFLAYLAIIIPVWLLLNDFVVPVMYRFNLPVGPAWSIVLGMLSGNFLQLILFYIIRLVVAAVKTVAGLLAGIVTCCIGFFPVVNQALIAPLHVFDRAYSMFALESMSPDFHMIRPADIGDDPFEAGDSGLRR